MAKAAKPSQKRTVSAHAKQSYIEFNAHNLREPAEEDSGVLGGEGNGSAGVPDASCDVSGEVSSTQQTPMKSSPKKTGKSPRKGSRSSKGKVSRILAQDFDSAVMMVASQ